MKREVFRCGRNSAYALHAISGEKPDQVRLSIYLYPHDHFWQRIKTAVAYVLDWDIWYSPFDDFFLNKEDVARLSQVLEPLLPEEADLTETEARNKLDTACAG
jgi:hypothetical protein